MKIGFTGTQNGMTPMQKLVVVKVLNLAFNPHTGRSVINEVHVGDCIGADKEFVEMVRRLDKSTRVIGHIPDKNAKRAFCLYTEERAPKPYLERNHDIVEESDFLIATPKEIVEQLRSGTWATIRYARKQGKKVVIIYPNGINEGVSSITDSNPIPEHQED
jgi:hypothetical protein